ncbi:sugar nucleotide-binding protein, partial [Tessaracoccus lubricantis]
VAGRVPGATGLPSDAFADGAAPVDLSAFDTVVHAVGQLASGFTDRPEQGTSWVSAAARATTLADLARRHRLRYVHVSADCVFEGGAPEHGEDASLDLTTPQGRVLAAGELIAGTVPRHLIIRTGWVVDPDEGFIRELAAKARHGQPVTLAEGQYGRLTFLDHLVLATRHLLDSGAEPGTYNVTGDGRAVSWEQVAQRVFQIVGANPALVRTAPAAGPAPALLRLEKLKATGHKVPNAWLDLIDIVPGAKPAAEAAPAPTADRPPARGRQPFRVLFVCTANICRSAYADVAARARGVDGLEFSSAGIQALVDQGIDPPMAALVTAGDATAHRARQLTRDMLEETDLVIAMASDHRRYILDSWPALGRKVFVIGHVARELASLPPGTPLNGVTEHLWRHRTADFADDVADPYGRGPAAAKEAADAIDGHLDTILGALTELARRA